MKIAIPTRNNQVDEHFGHCEYYTIFSVTDDKKIEKTEMYEAPQGCGCKSNIASILSELGVKIMLAGNMGQGAVQKIKSAGIEVFRGCTGDVTTLAESFLKNQVFDSGEICDHHDHDQNCNH